MDPPLAEFVNVFQGYDEELRKYKNVVTLENLCDLGLTIDPFAYDIGSVHCTLISKA